jgi:hypothetical protein
MKLANMLTSRLGMAIGFSADARNVDPQKIGNGAVLWARISLLLGLSLLAALAGSAVGRRRAAARVTHEIE